MTEASTDPTDLESALAAVFRGPLEEFVARRDALAKQLKASKRREDADQVKAVRKPSRTAWALNNVAFEDAAAMELLSAALTSAQEAQSRGDLRAGLDEVRAAARDFAAAASRAAIAGGHPIEPAFLVHAVTTVIGDATALAAMRTGRLVEIPEAGGLDFLTGVSPSATASPPVSKPSTPRATQRAERAAAAQADLEKVEKTLADARKHSEDTERAVRVLQAALAKADEMLQRAKEQSDTRRAELASARQEAKTLAAQLQKAEKAVADLRAKIENL